ncbi:MAG: DUF1624 domain-containing protein [Actinobacteria bacterium]|nr:DUF1624 domain-containing protein [Actinomycetota bacterium]
MAPTRRDTDTLSRAEEEALARAKRAVDQRPHGRGGATTPAKRKPAASGPRPRTSRARRRRPATPARSATLDLLRGVGVVATVLLLAGTAPSALPPWATPSAWHGVEPADLVLPLFLVVAGAAMAWRDATAAGSPVWRQVAWALRRVVVLVALGLALNWLAQPEPLRWSGLLQRIGLATFLGWLVTRLPRAWQIAAVALTVAGWGLALERLAAPGVGRGVLRPDENLVAWLDTSLLGPGHLVTPTDPLGLASLPAAVALVIGGRLLGGWLRGRPPGPATAAALAVTGGWLVVLGVVWGQLTPLNATLWTPPYLLFSAGAVLALAALVHLAGEVLPGARLLAPVGRLGRNALPAYLLPAGLVAIASRPVGGGASAWTRLVERFAAPVFGDLAPFVLAGLLLAAAWAVVGRLDARGWHLRA